MMIVHNSEDMRTVRRELHDALMRTQDVHWSQERRQLEIDFAFPCGSNVTLSNRVLWTRVRTPLCKRRLIIKQAEAVSVYDPARIGVYTFGDLHWEPRLHRVTIEYIEDFSIVVSVAQLRLQLELSDTIVAYADTVRILACVELQKACQVFWKDM